eukprot:m.169311 g.169311  ORF g.169311 m.169311 type:complete len:269 (+) comp38983_c0_seq1:146-952(+)
MPFPWYTLVSSFVLALAFQQHPVLGSDERNPVSDVHLHSSPCCRHLHNVKAVVNGQGNGFPLNCYEALKMGNTVSGIYRIDPRDGKESFGVFCDMTTDGGGWTVFQRRQDGSVDFFRNWNDYKGGFGDLMGEFWLGLDKIHRLTAHQTLRVDLADFENTKKFAQYEDFTVGNEGSQYVMNIGKYSGNAGDSLIYHSGMKFTTKDKDNDLECASTYKGAWWYNACHKSNLNGKYLKGQHSSYADGVNWYTWRGGKYSLKFTEMKIRPIQ